MKNAPSTASISPSEKRSVFQRLYDWTLSLAESRHAPLALGLVAFAESSFFPIPPDALLVPMSVAKPKRAWVFALICTIGSVLGALLGYAIGAFLYETVGKWLINLYGYGARVDELRALYAQWGWAVILIKGLTPIPFKIVTITSGLLAYNIPVFVALCLLTRGARFFILALLLNFYGEPIKRLLDQYFGLFLILLLVTVVGGFWIATRVL
ncbi:YqaA family protein [Beijerinckia indica]|uniref:DedA family n=1 Tax=Beijerinckia indica subsp. indica (strain ATCC 9039 / DSM 1715 / NCIMB 8712) TaxID=395963 RepID=B2IGZ3_BEII9|nr:YqaA family protein [Beijerinckia indica]ACB94407.1 DedA family [Beijerinckia indica subsp. indica ATCC 9039]